MRGVAMTESILSYTATLDRLADLKDLLKDRGRELADITELLTEIRDLTEEIRQMMLATSGAEPTAMTRSNGLLLKIAASPGGQWSMAILAVGYVWNGGNILTLLGVLSKLFTGGALP